MTKAKTALVTGATGFIGSHLVPALAARGWAVHALVRSTADEGVVQQLSRRAVIHSSDGSAGSISAAVSAVEPTHCFHLATHFVGVHASRDIEPLVRANIEFSTLVVEALAGRDCRFVNVGTIWQNQDARPYGPASLYAATKQAFEDVLAFYRECNGLDGVTVKLSDSYGPGDRRLKIVDLLLEAARSGEPIALSPGDQLIDLLHVHDVVSGLIAAAQVDAGHAFRLSSGAPMSLRALVERIESVIERAIPVVWGARPYRPREMFTDWGTDPVVHGWAPEIALERGIAELWGASRAVSDQAVES